jgi:hypothetical protein
LFAVDDESEQPDALWMPPLADTWLDCVLQSFSPGAKEILSLWDAMPLLLECMRVVSSRAALFAGLHYASHMAPHFVA